MLPELVRQTLLQFMTAFIILMAMNYLLVTRLFTRPCAAYATSSPSCAPASHWR
ncbi:MAG: hypothetical protein ACP5OY_09520 [Halothiobacillaceae bacterium]|jgi:hypothetical protein